jgi:hypothetical protein
MGYRYAICYRYGIPMGLVRTDMAFDNDMPSRWVTDMPFATDMPSRWDWHERKWRMIPICHPDGIGINGNGV